jgi:RimJ/RimL family protein N-acetyltransferase
LVTLREVAPQDLGAVVELLSLSDACRFALDDGGGNEETVHRFLDRVPRDREAGSAFTYLVLVGSTRSVAGLVQVRALDPAFESAEWECTLAPSARGCGIFLDVARLVGSFAFGVVGVHRLEARVLAQNGRGNGAMKKLGAVQEGILRRSICLRGQYLDQVLWSILKDDWGDHWVSMAPRVH